MRQWWDRPAPGLRGAEEFQIYNNTGAVTLKKCDAKDVYITTKTGSVTGSFLTDKVIFAKSNTGKIEIPQLTSGGKCEITTDTGDIKITIG